MRESKKKIEGPAIQKLKSIEDLILNISLFTICELMGGVEKSSNPISERKNIEFLLEHLRVVYPEAGFEVIYGEIYGELSGKGIMIPQMDLLIGCHAKILNMPLITKDVIHFNRIKGLVIQSY
jgi:tRNA(fMet)-specific endonuclease VapC